MVISHARLRTAFANQYLATLRQEWMPGGRPAQTDGHLELSLADGHCELAADSNALTVTLTARSHSSAALLEDLIAEVLDGLASGEELRYQWLRTADEVRRAPHPSWPWHFAHP